MRTILFENEINCCACGACESICPKQAIDMKENKEGFFYPHINREKCIECGVCQKVCAYQKGGDLHTPLRAYAAVNRDREQLLRSASGGAFAAIATYVLAHNGVVFGASLQFEDGCAVSKHIVIDRVEQLSLIQGSKYVQSFIGGQTYQETKKYLELGQTVLFSGTPCQIAGLYGYLGDSPDNLITIDLICHGVPNAKFFNDYLQFERKKRHAKAITGYSFRDKKKGWGMNSRIDMTMKRGIRKKIYIPARLNSYYTLFLDGVTYRTNCYSCPYAQKQRVSDLTIGDYWGIEVEHPELLGKYGVEEKDGISCVLANTKKGIQICAEVRDVLQESESSLEKVSRRNGQLNSPSKHSKSRSVMMNIYVKKGYKGVDMWFKKKYWWQLIVHAIYNVIPRKVRIRIKLVLRNSVKM